MMFRDCRCQTPRERPVDPEPAEYPKIKSAFRVARFTGGWCGWFLSRAVLGIPLIIGVVSTWYLGLASFVLCYGGLFVARRFSLCPRCGLAWSSEELESFVCSGCRLHIGLGLRNNEK
jgi:hypothetical protein